MGSLAAAVGLLVGDVQHDQQVPDLLDASKHRRLLAVSDLQDLLRLEKLGRGVEGPWRIGYQNTYMLKKISGNVQLRPHF